MSYQVLARKWRPANFSQMVGQEHVLQALTNALDSNRLHHAYLFSGTRGVGKTTIARIFAKSLNCEQGISSEPCGECASCSEIDQGRSVDLIEIDAASRTGVDDMRELLDNVQYAPTRSRFKIYLIDEVHMLSRHSFNALLKTLEEPPPHIKFLLATTDPQKMPVTVLSRCLQFNLKRMSRSQILSQLQYLTEQESITAQETALVQLASAADGSMRDALSLLDQAIGYGGGSVQQAAVESMLGSISRDYLERLLDALSDQQAAAMLNEARLIIEHSPDYQRVCAEMISLLQQVALYQADPKLVSEDEFGAEVLQKYSRRWSPEEIQLYYQIMLQGRQDLLICPDEAAGFEMLMLRLIAFSPRSDSELDVVEVKKKPDALVDSEKPQPEAVQPEAVQPEAVQPEVVQPEAVQPEAVQPEAV
ncbi:MAG: DNA polymerase III subunit gamma/tau, partial [Gammaproteobacteria bacterium]|nr:DNA polymerase III subunit gamma/tau [Gammaproteobacteria bacterium]